MLLSALSEASSQSGSLGSANGYQYIDSLQKGTTSGQWSAEFTNSADTSKKYKITMLPMADMEVAAGQTYGMGSSANTKQPILVAKKTVASTGNTDFVSVHEPYTTASQISSVTTEDGAVKVTKTSGDIDYIRYDVDNSKYALVTTDSSGTVQNIKSEANANVAVSGTTYLITSNVPDKMSVAFNGPVLNITQSPAYLGSVSIYTGSQTVTSVVVNGVAQSFTQSGSTILYGRAGIIALMTFITPKKLVSKMLRMTSMGVASNIEATLTPALFTTASIRPNLATPATIAASMLVGLVTSSSVTKIRSGFPAAMLLSGFRMVATTFHPSLANFLAVVFPNPVEQPVINIVFALKALLFF